MQTFREQLEDKSITGETCTIRFRKEDGTVTTLTAPVKELYTEEGQEFVVVGEGLRIPMSALLQVDANLSGDLC
jgi:hypothetical protein